MKVDELFNEINEDIMNRSYEEIYKDVMCLRKSINGYMIEKGVFLKY